MVIDRMHISGNSEVEMLKREEEQEEGVCSEEEDGMRCDSRASQTLLASW